MVMYPRKMYPKSSKEYLDDMEKIDGSFLNDDLMNSYYSSKNRISLYLIYNEKHEKDYKHTKREGMITGINFPGQFYAKMIFKNQIHIPTIFFLLLLATIVLVFIYL